MQTLWVEELLTYRIRIAEYYICNGTPTFISSIPCLNNRLGFCDPWHFDRSTALNYDHCVGIRIKDPAYQLIAMRRQFDAESILTL